MLWVYSHYKYFNSISAGIVFIRQNLMSILTYKDDPLHCKGSASIVTLYSSGLFNPLSPHDALKHHFTSLKTDLIFLQPRVLEQKFP